VDPRREPGGTVSLLDGHHRMGVVDPILVAVR
jgi:hypothetical protein